MAKYKVDTDHGSYIVETEDAPAPPPASPNAGQRGFEGYHSTLPWPLNKVDEATSDTVNAMSEGAKKLFGSGKTTDERLGGASQMGRGLLNTVGTPLLLDAGVTAPLKTTAAVGVGIPAQKVGEQVATSAGAGPGTSQFVGDAAGLVAGGAAAHFAPGAVDAIGTAAKVATDPAVVRAGVSVLPKGPAAIKFYDAIQAAKERVAQNKAKLSTQAAPQQRPQLGPGPVVTPPPADTSYVRSVPATPATVERPQLGPGPIVTPPPADPSGIIPGWAPTILEPEQSAAAAPPEPSAPTTPPSSQSEPAPNPAQASAVPMPEPAAPPAANRSTAGPIPPRVSAPDQMPNSSGMPMEMAEENMRQTPPVKIENPGRSEFYADGTRKSPGVRAEEIKQYNRNVKADKLATALNKDGVSLEDAQKMQETPGAWKDFAKSHDMTWTAGEHEETIAETLDRLGKLEQAAKDAPPVPRPTSISTTHENTLGTPGDEATQADVLRATLRAKAAKPPMQPRSAESPTNGAENITGTNAIAHRMVNGENNFIEALMNAGGITRQEAIKAMDTMLKLKVAKRDWGIGDIKIRHGAFFEPEAIRNAVNYVDEKQPVQPRSAPAPNASPVVKSPAVKRPAVKSKPDFTPTPYPTPEQVAANRAKDGWIDGKREMAKIPSTNPDIPGGYTINQQWHNAMHEIVSSNRQGVQSVDSGYYSLREAQREVERLNKNYSESQTPEGLARSAFAKQMKPVVNKLIEIYRTDGPEAVEKQFKAESAGLGSDQIGAFKKQFLNALQNGENDLKPAIELAKARRSALQDAADRNADTVAKNKAKLNGKKKP